MATAITAHTTDGATPFILTMTSDADGLSTVRIRGDLTCATTLRAELAAIPLSGSSLLVDLAGVARVDDDSLRAIVAFCARLRRAGVRIALMAADHLSATLRVPTGTAFAVSVSTPMRLH